MPSDPRKRILILDDEAALCEVLKARLDSFGYSAVAFTHSKDAWKEVLSSATPDLVLLDIRMPEEDGYTFLRRIRSFRNSENSEQENKIRNLPVIIVTGTGEGMKTLFEQERVSAFVTKPVDSNILKKLIEENLHS